MELRTFAPHADPIGGMIKIGACVVARIVYRPDYTAQGYVSADWQTAELMISLIWAGTLLVSGMALPAYHQQFTRRCES